MSISYAATWIRHQESWTIKKNSFTHTTRFELGIYASWKIRDKLRIPADSYHLSNSDESGIYEDTYDYYSSEDEEDDYENDVDDDDDDDESEDGYQESENEDGDQSLCLYEWNNFRVTVDGNLTYADNRDLESDGRGGKGALEGRGDIDVARKLCSPDSVPCAYGDVPREVTTTETYCVLAIQGMSILASLAAL